MIDFDPFCGQKLVKKHSKYVLKKFSKFSNFQNFYLDEILKIKLSSFWIKIEFAQKRVDPKLKWSKTRLYLMSTNMISLKIHDSKTFSKIWKFCLVMTSSNFQIFVQLNVLKNP